MLTQVKASWVTHMASVQKHWALVACSIGTMIGGAKYVSFCVCEWGLKWSEGLKASDQKRSIPLVCELGLLERRYAKLEADEDCGEILQVHARARLGGSRRRNCVLLKYTATGRRHVHLAAFDFVDLAGSLLLPSSLTSLFFSSFSFSFF